MASVSVKEKFLEQERMSHAMDVSVQGGAVDAPSALTPAGPSRVKMSKKSLIAHLQEMDKITDAEWMSSLDARKKAEMEFHDKFRDHARLEELGDDHDAFEHLYGNIKYYSATRHSWAYVNHRIAYHAKNKVFLDYACGDGLHTQKAAKAGAKLAIGIDISGESVRNARASAQREGLTDNTFFVQADAENTKLPDNSIDTLLCSGMMHHLDLSYAFPEIRRILVPGGRAIIFDALGYNPFINLYRALTPQMRTDWEAKHILTLKDLAFARRFFRVEDLRYWHIFGILTPHVPWAAPSRPSTRFSRTSLWCA